jgi:hypothetical protein
MKIIEDFNMEWHPETECVHVIVTHGDGTEEEVRSVKPPARPAWVNGDERDYQEWYDDILHELHKRGFRLSGEIA